MSPVPIPQLPAPSRPPPDSPTMRTRFARVLRALADRVDPRDAPSQERVAAARAVADAERALTEALRHAARVGAITAAPDDRYPRRRWPGLDQ